MRRAALVLSFVCAVTASAARAQSAKAAPDHLAGNTVLIIRHAEKPPLGRELTPTGQARAAAYVHYFEPFHEGGFHLRVNAIYAGADSGGSIRPRLTVEPLAQALHLPVDATVSTKDPAALVNLLRAEPHPDHPLIAWRHGSIPALLQAFGASADVIPGGKWPNDVYDWVIVLRFDGKGHVASERLVKENLPLQ